ncbi:MAG: JAB domain-containing protein [Flavobacteriaceae bacterium]
MQVNGTPFNVVNIYDKTKGGITGTLVDIKLLFVVVIKSKASGLILAHNHPSGNLKPSNNDITLTKKIREASKFLDIELIDHIIVSNKKYYSFKDEDEI